MIPRTEEEEEEEDHLYNTLMETKSCRLNIGRNRRETVRNWRGKINVDIREFYPKDGNLLPGKKGITLSLEQWNMLRDHVEEIDKALGHS